ncbi:MAG: dihydrodipicolinate synthase family protein [Planctomycetota bacterium]
MKRLDDTKRALLNRGVAIPAMPLALTSDRTFDERRQRALARYQIDAGVGGLAVAVHSTQFEIREPQYGLLDPVLSLTFDAAREWTDRPLLMVAGVVGKTAQAVKEAARASEIGYDAALLSMAAVADRSIDEMIAHARAVAEIMPVIGFYLQPSVGGRILPYAFWREFADIDNVIAIKMAPFNRYQTLDVVRAVCESPRCDSIALYTGNDDNIVIDLLTEYSVKTARGLVKKRIIGGLLGHWAVWTKRAVELLEECQRVVLTGGSVSAELLTRATRITDMNAAIFDPAHSFAGCIPGIHRVLQRQGLLRGIECLNPHETLSDGQDAEIERVCREHSDLTDDAFIAENLARWLAD